MRYHEPIPQSLKIVAWLFIIGGVLSAINVIVSLLFSRININLGVLGFFIGKGLLHLNPNSLKWAMVATWFELILLPIATVLFLFTPGHLKIFGVTLGPAPPGLGFIFGVAFFALACWQYNVLTNREVRQLFY